jgi:hypothetical protein
MRPHPEAVDAATPGARRGIFAAVGGGDLAECGVTAEHI